MSALAAGAMELLGKIGIKNVLIAVVLVALVAFAGLQSHRLAEARDAVVVAEGKVAGLVETLELQNAGIAEAAKTAKAKAEASRKAVAAARALQGKAEKRARQVEAAPAPVGCDAALQLLVNEAGAE